MRLLGIALCALVAVSPAIAARNRAGGENLLSVSLPEAGTVARAHPAVNVIVAFGAASDGTPADPATFRARLGRVDVTDRFHVDPADGRLRAALPQALVRLVRAPRNRLRLSVSAARGAKHPRVRDVDRVRFGAADAENQPPVPVVASDADVVTPGATVTFDARGSSDADQDELAFRWDFGDGATAEGAVVTHQFGAATADVVIAVTVSDGEADVPAEMRLPVTPVVDPGRTPGTLAIDGDAPLEFGAVPLGGSAARTLTLRNTDPTPTSQVKIRAVLGAADAFALSTPTITLGPTESASLAITFAPASEGHRGTALALAASATNRQAVSLLAHGYGGAAAGNGPTLVGVPVFTAEPDLAGIMPDGRPFAVASEVGLCGNALGGGSGDVCVTNADCTEAGETCTATTIPFDVAALCGDGQSLFLLSSEGTFTDPNPDAQTERAETLLRVDLDAAGATTGMRILDRTTEETAELACDAIPRANGGLVYLAEFHAVTDTDGCPRDERESLVRVDKESGDAQVVNGLARLDAAAGVGECADRDPASAMQVSGDGAHLLVAFESAGLWRVRPSSLFISPDVHDGFALHPDGDIVIAATHDHGTAGSIDLYRIVEDQAVHGALPLASLSPCASVAVPNNATSAEPGRTLATSLVVAPVAGGARDAAALVTFVAGPTVAPTDVLPFGNLRGTVAFALPADTTSCTAIGLTSLDGRALAR